MEAPDSLLKSLHKRLLFLNRISLADMESTGCPLNLSLKVEEQEEEIQSRALESGPTDTQKVRICSEGGWVSECAGVAAASTWREGRPEPGRSRPPPGQTGSKNSRAKASVCIPKKSVL